MNGLAIFIGGGLGSLARYGITLLTPYFYKGNFPLATFIANMFACILVGVVIYTCKDKITSSWIQLFLITGFCGGFSTFSTWSNETLTLLTTGNWFIATVNILFSLIIGVGLLMWLRLN